MALKYLYVPSGYKGGGSSGTAYGVLPNTAAADLAFVRGSAGTRVNADGLIESEATNIPRLDYTDGSCPTLLTEPERTNLVVNSAGGYDPDSTPYTNTAAPDGSNTARIKTPTTVFNRFEHIVNALSLATDTKVSYSWYRKRLSTPDISTYVGDVHIYSLVNTTQVGSTIEIESNISGYDRFSATFNITNGSIESKIRLYFGDVVGVGNSSIAYFGHQVEVGEYATSYTPTSGATVTRSADTGVISGDLSSYINSSEGVLEIKAKALFNGGSSVRIAVSDGTADNRINLIWASSSNTMQLGIKSNGNNVLDGGNTFFENFTHDQTQMATFKIKWKSGDIQVKMNEEVVITDTSSFSGLVLNRLRLDAGYGSNTFEGNIQYIKVYDSVTDF